MTPFLNRAGNTMFERTLAILLAAAIGVAVTSAPSTAAPPAPQVTSKGGERPTDKVVRSSKIDLTPKTFPRLHALVRPQEHEWRHLKVHWLTDVVAARKRAAAQNKPIIICYTGGAGYNEPLGVC